jgi:phenylacetate-CoA ligase
MLTEQQPDYLDGYASIIFEIARAITPAERERIRPKIILLNSEMSTDYQRKYISDVFNCPVFDEYSTEETWMVASQCKYHNYHIFTDNVWVEIVDSNGNEVPKGETGEIILTTLKSPVMPFIRYRIGDMGRLGTKGCKCGSPFPVLESFEGRQDDSFILPDGTFVSSLKILNTFTVFINKYLHLMEEFKVVQMEKNHVVIQLVKGKQFVQEQFKEVLDALDKLFGNTVEITVNFEKSIDNTGKIKRKAIESRILAS